MGKIKVTNTTKSASYVRIIVSYSQKKENIVLWRSCFLAFCSEFVQIVDFVENSSSCDEYLWECAANGAKSINNKKVHK